MRGFPDLAIKYVSGKQYANTAGVFRRVPMCLAKANMPQARVCVLGVVTGGNIRTWPAGAGNAVLFWLSVIRSSA